MNTKERLLNEIWSSITHGIGITLSIAAFVLLIIKGVTEHSEIVLTSFLVYGIALMTLYTASTLFHSLYFTKARTVFQAMDHCSIFILIAGTYTPYCLLAIKGTQGAWMLSVIWILSILGILFHLFVHNNKFQWIETLTYVLMGWLCLLGAKSLFISLGKVGFILLVIGGLMFTFGAAIYSIKGVKYVHVYWHIFVMLGSISMFFSIYLFL
ncbi:hemolysin III family protein [Lactobacillus sp. UCMA15818]|uniref:PAQR family membrane homeostasis protein TrhA n=1 Tax=Lactobacillaceae TaxID=33958 RepID=UPI0025B1A942|nr:hemolysin III family protein [Lactobacillus sp. UCMA15818]MDN2454275.1 hemolysin III family protein [Lactobacillus sp. UCMA15818]